MTQEEQAQEEQTQPEQPRKIAVVTGATGGMGREIAADLSKDHHVYALGRNETGPAGLRRSGR